MSMKDIADEVIRKQREKALSRREEAEGNYLMLSAQAIDGMSEADKAERDLLEKASNAATDALDARCKACPNADICIASLRNACPHFLRMEVAERRRVWHEFIHATAHYCGECDACDHDRCWCKLHKKVVELDTPACADIFPDTTIHGGGATDPDPMWFPNRPLSSKEQEQRNKMHRETAERLAKIKRENPAAWSNLLALDKGRYEAYEKEFPDLFGGEAHGQS